MHSAPSFMGFCKDISMTEMNFWGRCFGVDVTQRIAGSADANPSLYLFTRYLLGYRPIVVINRNCGMHFIIYVILRRKSVTAITYFGFYCGFYSAFVYDFSCILLLVHFSRLYSVAHACRYSYPEIISIS